MIGPGQQETSSKSLKPGAIHISLGIAVLPTWAVTEPLRTGALRRLLTAWEPPASMIYAVYSGNRLLSMKDRAFVNHLVHRFGQAPYWDDSL